MRRASTEPQPAAGRCLDANRGRPRLAGDVADQERVLAGRELHVDETGDLGAGRKDRNRVDFRRRRHFVGGRRLHGRQADRKEKQAFAHEAILEEL
jgi:hypothetical protein